MNWNYFYLGQFYMAVTVELISQQKTVKYHSLLKFFWFGEMAERSNAAVLKTVIPGDRDRGFESHSLLHTSLIRAFRLGKLRMARPVS